MFTPNMAIMVGLVPLKLNLEPLGFKAQKNCEHCKEDFISGHEMNTKMGNNKPSNWMWLCQSQNSHRKLGENLTMDLLALLYSYGTFLSSVWNSLDSLHYATIRHSHLRNSFEKWPLLFGGLLSILLLSFQADLEKVACLHSANRTTFQRCVVKARVSKWRGKDQHTYNVST